MLAVLFDNDMTLSHPNNNNNNNNNWWTRHNSLRQPPCPKGTSGRINHTINLILSDTGGVRPLMPFHFVRYNICTTFLN